MITSTDEKRIGKMILNTIVDAMEQILFPKFDKIDERFDKLEGDVSGLKDHVGGLKQAVEILDNDMGGVKMRLKVVENKLDGLIDSTLVVRDHEKRISKLEKAVT